jgi:hypothetical protein
MGAHSNAERKLNAAHAAAAAAAKAKIAKGDTALRDETDAHASARSHIAL